MSDSDPGQAVRCFEQQIVIPTYPVRQPDPMLRMKGMVGIRFLPGKALIEARVRVYNRTPLPQMMQALAGAGLGDGAKAAGFLREALAEDPNCLFATEMLTHLDQARGSAGEVRPAP